MGASVQRKRDRFLCGGNGGSSSNSDISRGGGGFCLRGCRVVHPVTVTSLRVYLLLLLLLFPLGSVRCENPVLVACFTSSTKHDPLASCEPPHIDGGGLPPHVVDPAYTSVALTAPTVNGRLGVPPTVV
eukprot:g7086.t1